MIVKVSVPNRFQFKAVPSFTTMLWQKKGEVHYIGGADILPPPLESKKEAEMIALLGTEGEKSRSEGGESYTFEDAPKQIYDTLNRYRLARVGGKTYEAEKKQT